MKKLIPLLVAALLPFGGRAAAAEYYQGQGYVRVHDSVGVGYEEQNDNVVFGSFLVHLHDFTPGEVIRVKVENRGHHPTAAYAKVAGPWTLTMGDNGQAKTPQISLPALDYKVKIQLDYGLPTEVKDYYNFEVRDGGAQAAAPAAADADHSAHTQAPAPAPAPKAVPASTRTPATTSPAHDHHPAAPATPGEETPTPVPSPVPAETPAGDVAADPHAAHRAAAAGALHTQAAAATRPEGAWDGRAALLGIAGGFGLGVCASLLVRRRPQVRPAEGP